LNRDWEGTRGSCDSQSESTRSDAIHPCELRGHPGSALRKRILRARERRFYRRRKSSNRQFRVGIGGTKFLDAVGGFPLELQPTLLRVLQEREYEPVGSSRTRKVDVRVIEATNQDLAAEVKAGPFREDLFCRPNVFPISVPPLREHSAGVELLARLIIERYHAQTGKPPFVLAAEFLSFSGGYDPTNGRGICVSWRT